MVNNDSLNGSLADTYPPSLRIALYALGIPVGLAVTIGNIVFLVFLKHSHTKQHKTLKTKTSVALASLCVSETFAGLVLVISCALHSLYDVMIRDSPYGCYFWMILHTLPILSCFLHLAAVVAERYIQVSRSTHYPTMKQWRVVIWSIWVYVLVFGLIALAFPVNPSCDALGNPLRCDVMVLPPSYVTGILLVHSVVSLGAVLICQIKVRSTVKMHHRKIQVSNTITYNNMMDDSVTAKLFTVAAAINFVCWLPFFVTELLLFAQVPLEHLPVIARWSYLVGNVAYLKFLWYFLGSRALRADCKKTFTKEKIVIRAGTVKRGDA